MKNVVIGLYLSSFLMLSSLFGQSKTVKDVHGIEWGCPPDTAISILGSQNIMESPWSPGEEQTAELVLSEADKDSIVEITFKEFWFENTGQNHYLLRFLPKQGFQYAKIVVGTGIDGFQRSFQVLSKKYGKPSKESRPPKTIWGQPESRYTWELKNAALSLEYHPSDGAAVSTSGLSEILYRTRKWIQYENSKKQIREKQLLKESLHRF